MFDNLKNKKISTICLYEAFNQNHYHMIFDNLKFFYFLHKQIKNKNKIEVSVEKTFKVVTLEEINNYFIFFKLPFLIKKHKFINNPFYLKINKISNFVGSDFLINDNIKKFFTSKKEKLEFITFIRTFCKENEKYKNKKIVINRYSNRKIPEYIINELKNKGFEEVFFENLNLQDQIDIFYNAEEIVAVHGAALTNVLFANNNLKITEISINHNLNCFIRLIWFIKELGINIDYKSIKDMNTINSSDKEKNKTIPFVNFDFKGI